MKRVLISLMLTTACACSEGPEEVTLVLYNGRIWTGNRALPTAQAVAITANRITFVGNDAEALRLGPDASKVNLEGRRVVPGFNDAHVHFFEGGMALTGPALRYTKSPQEFRNTLAEFAKHYPRGRWITGGEWDHENWSPPALPKRQLIDPVTRDWPVFVSRLDGHMSLANSLALKLAGINKETEDVPGGVIVRDDKGEPTGILKDAAQDLVSKVIPVPPQDEIMDALRAAAANANVQGITSVQDMYVSPEVVLAYRELARIGELHVRVSLYLPLEAWGAAAQERGGDEYFRIVGVKGFSDGSLGSTTALFFDPYLDAPKTNGIASAELSNPARMYGRIAGADSAGLQIAIHAIGDRANDAVLSMYERLEREHGERDRRLRIEHAQHLRPQDVPRFAHDRVIASMQPYHAIDDGRWAENRIGLERAKTSYAWRSLLYCGTVVAFGSDWPVAPISPLQGIYGAVTRRTLDGKHENGWIPEQRITVEEAVRAYTQGSAYASFEDKQKGTIEPGKLADLAVLDDDIFSIDPARLSSAKVHMIVFDGQVVMPEPLCRHCERLPSGLILRK